MVLFGHGTARKDKGNDITIDKRSGGTNDTPEKLAVNEIFFFKNLTRMFMLIEGDSRDGQPPFTKEKFKTNNI